MKNSIFVNKSQFSTKSREFFFVKKKTLSLEVGAKCMSAVVLDHQDCAHSLAQSFLRVCVRCLRVCVKWAVVRAKVDIFACTYIDV